ncbi:MAG: hydantoinase/oxoprolinase family protein [Armatimonadetes bacterium]|nr:hydantoinase/oxoprolinase family protein [Armatimonadota bacterium]
MSFQPPPHVHQLADPRGGKDHKTGGARVRLGVDVGGTFTDLSVFHEETGSITVYKTPTTAEDQSLGIISGARAILELCGAAPEQVGYFAHGTTVATNSLLEAKMAKVGLITTRGFRDLLEIRRQIRPTLYDLFFVKPEPPITRDLRLEVTERVGPAGEVLQPLDEQEARSAIAQLVSAGVSAIAICFLYSFLYPEHEERVAALARQVAPEIPVWTSHQVLPEFREFERLSTTVANAALGPVMGRYLSNLRTRVAAEGVPVGPYIMQSNGGVMSVEVATRRPAHTLMSGPAAGVIGAIHIGQLVGIQNLVTFDMGGTSTDVCLVEKGVAQVSMEKEIAGYPVRIPMVDVHSIGAGGGSVAWIDAGGRLKVGPRSMGARPGPAAYALGGDEPTVSDANIVLGRLNPHYLLGGKMKLEPDRAWKTIEEKVAKPLGLGVVEAAEGILTIVNSNMVLATRVVSVERGYDPREFVLVAFGGAGPLHATEVAAELGVHQVLIPEAPGIVCALGTLTTDLRTDYVHSIIVRTAQARPAQFNAMWQELEQRANRWLDQEGVPADRRLLERSVDMRYVGQNYEITVAAPGGEWDGAAMREMETRFHARHQHVYGDSVPGEPTQIINLRVTAYGFVPKADLRRQDVAEIDGVELLAERRVYWGSRHGFVATPVYNRARLAAGQVVEGPAILEQMDSTTVLGPGQTARVDEYRNLRVEIKGWVE